MRGLFLAVFALLIVVGDTGRYAPQLVANATTALSYVRGQAASHFKPSAQPQDQEPPQLTLPLEFTAENTYRVRSAFALLWHAAQLNSDDAQRTLMTSIEEITSHQLNPESHFPSPPGASADSDELLQQRPNEQTAANTSTQVPKLNAIYWLEKLVSIDNADAAWLLYQLNGVLHSHKHSY